MTDVHFDEHAAVERPRVLTEEEILACTDARELRRLQAAYEVAAIAIEVMLQCCA